MQEFLDSFSKKSTRRMYKRGIELFCQWYGKDVETILQERKDDLTPRPKESFVDTKQRASRYEKLLEKFHSWLIEQGYKINSARTMCLGIMQMLRYYNMGITLRTGSPVSQTVVTTSDFILQPEHVRAMFHIAKDLRSKLLISVGNDLGWRISDILGIQRSELPNLEQKPPIEWIRITKKEKVVAKSCLSKTTVTLLKEYLSTFHTENTFLFHNNAKGHIDEETVTARLRDLAREAGIELGNMKLRWHCFRKMTISQAKNLGIDPDIIKLMVGKSVKKDVLTYMSGIDIKTAFNKLQEVLGIRAFTEESENVVEAMESKLGVLDNAMSQLEQENLNFKTRIDMLQKSQKDNVNQIAELRKQNDDVKRVLGEVMKEKNVVRVLTIPEKSKVIHYMKKEDGTMKKMEEDYLTFVARGRKTPKEFQYWKKKGKQREGNKQK